MSTPLAWEELDDPGALVFEAGDVLERVEEHGDLFAPVLELRAAAARAVAFARDGRLVACPPDRAPRRRRRRGAGARSRPGGACAPSWSRTWPATRGSSPRRPCRAPELVSRAEWASANLESLSDLLDPVAERLDQRLAFAGPLAGALRVGAAATLAAEAGLVMGYVSQRVLGQYDLSLLAATARRGSCSWRRTSRGRCASSSVERDAFERWIAPTSSRTSSSSRACPGCASTWRR